MAENITITVPATTLALSDKVSIAVGDIHPAAWPGLINGVLRNTKSEASRAVINRIHTALAEAGEYVKDTKENRDAGKTPTSLDAARELRERWHAENSDLYDAWMTEEEQSIVDSLRDGTFRVREASGPRVTSLTPEESRARDIGRAEFDDVVLPENGFTIPRTKAGGRHAPNSKALADLEIVGASGTYKYPDALSRYVTKHHERLAEAARKALAAEAKQAQKAKAEGHAALDI